MGLILTTIIDAILARLEAEVLWQIRLEVPQEGPLIHRFELNDAAVSAFARTGEFIHIFLP
ncbi:MAG: hypothetical protein ACJA1U_000519 [Bermanella sp.]|jgi:hypothetical protein